MKNKLTDLHNHLFETLERLNDGELKGDELREEMDRAKAITAVSGRIIENAGLILRAYVAVDERSGDGRLPKMMLDGD